ncbi:uncharacterized protein LOC128206421 isoform X3 [Mya arenaria]|uniref:uncharacterized protein LOC128206421 isoform X3 n=1 Tax=Mya arenaria TaxID=6604 RepID=UPI0022E5F02F|nr:uncharacterized protein LOC128206421 isoform X3 [Mya arenaria]
MASTPVYWFERKENRNWVKLAVGLIITKSGLATFEEQTVETLKNDQDPLGSSLVRDIGRKVRNASKFEVSDVEIKQCFENMRALFTAPQHLAVNATAHATVAQLNKLETEQMQVKRTDVMEAINFIDEQRFKDVENGESKALLIFHCAADKALAREIEVGLKSFGCFPIMMDITTMDRFGVHALQHLVDSCRILGLGLFIFTNETSDHFRNYAKKVIYGLPPDMSSLIILVLQSITKEELGIDESFTGKIFEYQDNNDFNIKSISLAITGASAVGGSIDGGYEYSPRVSTIFTQAGFRKIIPDDLTAIQYDTTVIGTMYIWIYYVDENNIYHWLYSGLGRRPDCDVLVGPDGKIHYTKHGEIWIQK